MKGYSTDTKRRILNAMPGSSKEIAERVKVDKSIVCFVINDLMRAQMAHIGAWRRHTPIYAAGEGADAPAPSKAARKPVLRNPAHYTLRPRVDPMVWATTGRRAPEVRA